MDIGKIILFYLCMAIAVSFFFPQIVIDPDTPTSILGIFNVTVNSTTNEVVLGQSSSFADSSLNIEVENNASQTGIFSNIVETASTYYQSFIDGLKNVITVVKILYKFMFSPLIFVFNPNLMGDAPIFVKMIFALPLIILALLGLVYFMSGRGKNA